CCPGVISILDELRQDEARSFDLRKQHVPWSGTLWVGLEALPSRPCIFCDGLEERWWLTQRSTSLRRFRSSYELRQVIVQASHAEVGFATEGPKEVVDRTDAIALHESDGENEAIWTIEADRHLVPSDGDCIGVQHAALDLDEA